MSVASIEKEDVVPPTSGSGMDRVVAKKGLPTRLKIAAGVVVVVALAAIFFWFAPRAGTQNGPADHVTISPVTKGTFDAFIPLRPPVTPLVKVCPDTAQGRRAEKVRDAGGAPGPAGAVPRGPP